MTGVNTWLLKITKKILCKKTLARYIYFYIYLNIIYIYLNIYHLLCVHMIFIYSFLYVSLWIDDHNSEKQNIRGPKKPLEGRYIISEFNIETGEPLGPYARKFVQHCGCLVRDKLPISAHEWKQKINEPHVSFVSDLDKNLI